jgi:hypothetical protein
LSSQIDQLRSRVRKIRAARGLLAEYQSYAPAKLQAPLEQLASWLQTEEERTISFGQSLMRQEGRDE